MGNKGLPLLGDRILLRDFRQEDWVDVHGYASREDVVEHMVWGPNTEVQTKEFVNMAVMESHVPIHERESFTLAVAMRETGRVLGGCSLIIESRVHKRAEIGYCFHPDVWGQGIGTEAVGLLLEFGFRLGLHRIYATCDPGNPGSRRVLEKTGFALEGVMKHHLLGRKGWRDSCIYATVVQG